MFIFNVLPLREFRSPKSQFAMVNVCVLSMYYHVFAKFASIIDPFTLCFRHLPRQTTLGNFSELRAVCPHSPRNSFWVKYNHANSAHFAPFFLLSPNPVKIRNKESRFAQIRV